MTIEIITKYHDRYVLHKESMTWFAWVCVGTNKCEKSEGFIAKWPVVEVNGVETLYTPGIESHIQSWREIPDEKPELSSMPILPSTVLSTGAESKTTTVHDDTVSVSSPTSVSDSGTDWIK